METTQKQRYNPAEAAEIVKHLTDGFLDPEYILLFGTLVGGTPHSDATAYDLLVVVRESPKYDWIRAKRILRCRMPVRQREITYINLYIMTLKEVESHSTPFLYFAHSEGDLLYCRDHYHFRRPKHPVNFPRVYADAKLHFDAFGTLAKELTELAQEALGKRRNRRLAALLSAQAVVCYYHTLYYVYHGQRFESHDPMIMHDRMRTLSTQLMIAFDDNHLENTLTMPYLKQVFRKAHYDVDFEIPRAAVEMQLDCVVKLGEIIENRCGERLELYKERCDRQ